MDERDEAITKINALDIDTQEKYDLYAQFEEDCEEHSVASAMDKLNVAIRDLREAVPA